MARPTKQGLEYFPMDVDANTDEKIEFLTAKCGYYAFGVYVTLLMKIYKNGYFLEWTERQLYVTAKQVMMNVDGLKEIIDCCIEAELFDRGMFEKHNILTSRSIQERFSAATEKRKSSSIEQYSLLGVNSEKTPSTEGVNSKKTPDAKGVISEKTAHEKELFPKKPDESEVNSELMPQSKVKESKVNINKFIYAENVKMTKEEYEALKARLNGNEHAVLKCIEILDNYKGSSGKKYKSDYRAILTWVIDKYEKEHGKPPLVSCPIHQGDDDFGLPEAI